ncbi:MAG TPA: acyl-homoserine-lactone synthase [Xanthobacteraceae bacterium]|jgi:N-acyl-L-homoserine lactone synthetase
MHANLYRYDATFCTEEQNPSGVDAMLQLRKQLFVDLYRWELTVVDGRERDQFDTPTTVHCLLHRDRTLIGGFRAIRTDDDYLVRSVFPYLAAIRSFPQRSDYWEISRFGVLPIAHRLEAAKINYALMFRFAQLRQALGLVALADLTYERFLSKLGIRTRRYGPPQVIGTDAAGTPLVAVAGEIPMSEQNDHRFHALLALTKHMEINDAALVLGRSRISA